MLVNVIFYATTIIAYPVCLEGFGKTKSMNFVLSCTYIIIYKVHKIGEHPAREMFVLHHTLLYNRI